MKVIVVMPAYNAEKTLQKTIADIPYEYVDEIILVDDASKDKTVALANEIGSRHSHLTLSKEIYEREPHNKILFTVHTLDTNKGYGGNQKKCYELALNHGGDIIIMLHPDYQYDPKIIKYFVDFIKDGYFNVMLGSRIRSRKEALFGGMPRYKYYSNRALSMIQNIFTGLTLTEWHTGMRGYTSSVLRNINFNNFSDDFVFDTQMLFAVVEKGYPIGDIPVPVKYFEDASSINFKRSLRYGFLTLFETIKFAIRKYKQVITYVFSGASAALLNISLYLFFIYLLHIWYVIAAIIAFICGAFLSFVMQKYLTFKNTSHDTLIYQISIYSTIMLLNSFFNSFLLFMFVQKVGLNRFIGNILSNTLVAVWSFFLYKHLAFKVKEESKTGVLKQSKSLL